MLGRAPIAAKADAAAAAGFDGISVYAREYVVGLPRIVGDLGLAVAEIDGAMSWLAGNQGPEPAAVIDLACALRARAITVLESSGIAVDPTRAAEAFARVCDLAWAADPRLLVHIEPFPFSGIASVAAASEIVQRAQRPNGGILLDTWHLARGDDGGLIPDGADGAHIAGLQISGVAAVPGADVREECMQGRLAPNAWTRRVVSEARGRGCTAPLEIEVFSAALDGREPKDIAQYAMASLQALAPWPVTDIRPTSRDTAQLHERGNET
jgi:sugar phosphate isomerase/epimerase